MNVYEIKTMSQRLTGNPYPGRGVVLGKSADGKKAVAAYFIMGRSNNSRNRVFVMQDDSLYTKPFDASLVEDPSLIIYAAVRKIGNHLIVTNGDQTDTIYMGIAAGMSFAESLESRRFEPDAPNWTPRISGLISFENKDFSYQMSILKSGDAEGTVCSRYTYRYTSLPGLGHFIHTYITDGNPIPTFCGEPERIAVPNDIDEFTNEIWNSLDANNKISLYVSYTDLETGEETIRIVNKNQ